MLEARVADTDAVLLSLLMKGLRRLIAFTPSLAMREIQGVDITGLAMLSISDLISKTST